MTSVRWSPPLPRSSVKMPAATIPCGTPAGRPGEGAAYYSTLVDDEACLVTLARDGGRVAGHLIGKLNGPGSMLTGRIAVLESMRVAPGSRRTGAGSMLVRHFLTWARDCGAQQASVTAYAANNAAQRLYARHGFEPASVTLPAIL